MRAPVFGAAHEPALALWSTPLPHCMGVRLRARAPCRGYATKLRGLIKIETASDCNLAGFGRALAHGLHPFLNGRGASLRTESAL